MIFFYFLLASLSKWGISNDCLLYTFARPLRQSGVELAVTDERTSPINTTNGIRLLVYNRFLVYIPFL